MGTYEELKAAIQQVIRTNGNNEITGANLQNALLSIINVVGANATFAGIATPNTNPGIVDQNVFYLATEAGTYVNFGGIEINMGGAVILSNKTGNWVKTTSGFVTQQQLTKLSANDVTKGLMIDSIYHYILRTYYYDVYGNLSDGLESYFALPIFRNPDKRLRISHKFLKTQTIRCFDRNFAYIGNATIDIIANTTDVYFTPLPNTEYMGYYAALKDSANFENLQEQYIYGLDSQYIIDQKKSMRNIDGYSINENNYTKSTTWESGYLTSSENITESSNYETSGFIRIDTQYILVRNARKFVWCDSDKKQVSFIDISETNTFRELEKPTNAVYARVTRYTRNDLPLIVAPTLTDSEGVHIADRGRIIFSSVSANNILYRKKWCVCGDSFSVAGYAQGDAPIEDYIYQEGRYAGQQIVYPYIIGLRNGMDVINLAQGGMTMCNINGDRANSLSNTVYRNIPLDADYITIKLGINDHNFNSPLGTIDDTTTTTFYGAYNVVLDYITQNCPFAKIGIIVTNGSSKEYTDATLAIAKKWGIAFIDEVNDPSVPLLHRVQREGVSQAIYQRKLEAFRVSETNTHPNTKAQYYEASFIENWLRSL